MATCSAPCLLSSALCHGLLFILSARSIPKNVKIFCNEFFILIPRNAWKYDGKIKIQSELRVMPLLRNCEMVILCQLYTCVTTRHASTFSFTHTLIRLIGVGQLSSPHPHHHRTTVFRPNVNNESHSLWSTSALLIIYRSIDRDEDFFPVLDGIRRAWIDWFVARARYEMKKKENVGLPFGETV